MGTNISLSNLLREREKDTMEQNVKIIKKRGEGDMRENFKKLHSLLPNEKLFDSGSQGQMVKPEVTKELCLAL